MIGRSRNIKPRRGLNLAIATLFFAAQLPFMLFAAPQTVHADEEIDETISKVKVCHLPHDGADDEYEKLSVDINSLINSNGHSNHSGDIYSFTHDGQLFQKNFSDENKAIFDNDCVVPSSEPRIPGNITIVKDVKDGTDEQDFTFTGGPINDPTYAEFILDDDEDGERKDSVSFEAFAGEYTVTEAAVDGWVVADINCNVDATLSEDGRTATFMLAADQDVTCTFVNQRAGGSGGGETGSVTIVKDVKHGHDAQDFTFTGGPAEDPDAVTFSLDDDEDGTLSNQYTRSGLAFGQYTVTENEEDGWKVKYIDCNVEIVKRNDGRTATFMLTARQDVICTFVNEKDEVTPPRTGTIDIIKDVREGTDEQDFTFNGGPVEGPAVPEFKLDDDGDNENEISNRQTYSRVAPGVYTVTEEAVEGWVVADIVCEDTEVTISNDGRTATFTLVGGAYVKCTFVNQRAGGSGGGETGSVTIVKDVKHGHDAQDFTFTGGPAEDPDAVTFSLDDDEDGTLSDWVTYDNLIPGEYTVTEHAVQDWKVKHIKCTADGEVIAFTKDSRTIDFALTAGSDVTCTFVNMELEDKEKPEQPVEEEEEEDDENGQVLGTNTGGSGGQVLGSSFTPALAETGSEDIFATMFAGFGIIALVGAVARATREQHS